MNPRAKKWLLALLAMLLLVGVSRWQIHLNRERDRLGLTRVQPLENAPPVLAFTTVALGGFRGLIANALWIRANDLQDEGKYFEMVQLADWITKLEPHYTQVWLVQAWNMAYNISVKFKDPADRWRWVQRGIALLRDDGLRFNPNDVLIYRELAWFFQHKMGHNLDDAHLFYKRAWRDEMQQIFRSARPDFDELINPQTDDARERARLLRERYKLDPAFMKQVDAEFGPLEWRLPEAHAIYWAARGLAAAEQNPAKVNPDLLIQLRRSIYQSMQMSFHRGRLVENPPGGGIDFGPNVDIIPNVNKAYEKSIAEESEANRENIRTAHRNFLRDAIYFLYTSNREAEANEWYRYLAKLYPHKPMIEGRPDSLPANLSVYDYCFARVEEEVGDTSRDKTRALLEGLLATALHNLVLGEYDRAQGFMRFAERVWERYRAATEGTGERIPIPPLTEIRDEVARRLLEIYTPEAANLLRAQLGWPPPTNAPAASPAPPPPR